jgi:hypothetical protein
MKRSINEDEIRVASPCHARWEDMGGDEQARFCRQCSKNVFNLSAMTRVQIADLIREKEGKFCGRFYRRADGRMLTADCPSRLRQMRERLARIGGALCALALSLLGCSRQASQPRAGNTGHVLMGDVALPPTVCATNNSPEIMGKIAVPAPPSNNAPALLGEVYLLPETNRLHSNESPGSGK